MKPRVSVYGYRKLTGRPNKTDGRTHQNSGPSGNGRHNICHPIYQQGL